MFGQGSEAVEKFRAQQKAQYAADLKRQIEEQAKQNVRQSVAQQMIQNQKPPCRQIQILQKNRLGAFPHDEMKEIPLPKIQETYVQDPEPASTRRQPESPPKCEIPQYNPPNNDIALQNLQFTVDRIISIDLPNRIKPCEDAISNINMKVERSITSNNEQIQNLRDKFSEITISINNISRRLAENSDKIRFAISEVQQDNQRLRDSLSMTNNRVQNLEGYMGKLEESFNTISMRQGMLEQSVAQSVGKLQQIVTGLSTSTQAGDQHLMTQIESLNKQTVTALLQANSNIQQLSESINSLTENVKQSFSVVRKEFDDRLIDMTQKTQNATLENAQAFQTLQEEVVETFNSLKDVVEQSNRATEAAIQREYELRQNDNMSLLEANDIFTSAVAGQLTNLAKAIERTNSNIKSSVETGCAMHLGTWRGDLDKFISETVSNVQECQGKMRAVENKLANDSNLESRINKLENLINQYNSRLEEMEQNSKKNEIAPSPRIPEIKLSPKNNDDVVEKIPLSPVKINTVDFDRHRPPPISTAFKNQINQKDEKKDSQEKAVKFKPPQILPNITEQVRNPSPKQNESIKPIISLPVEPPKSTVPKPKMKLEPVNPQDRDIPKPDIKTADLPKEIDDEQHSPIDSPQIFREKSEENDEEVFDDIEQYESSHEDADSDREDIINIKFDDPGKSLKDLLFFNEKKK